MSLALAGLTMEVLATLFKSMSTKLGQVGRPSSSARAKKEKLSERAAKILCHEETCVSFLKRLEETTAIASSQQSPARKRLKVKSPRLEVKEEQAVKQENAADGPDSESMRVLETKYKYPDTTNLRTRKMAIGLGAQKFTRRAQQHLLAHTHDLDIHNSVFTVLCQLLDKLQVSPVLPKDIQSALDRCVSSRDQVCKEELKVSREEGKKVLTAVLYGSALPENFSGNDFLIRLNKVSLYFRWLAMSLLEDEFHRFRKPEVNKKNPDMSILSHLYLAAEDYILTAWVGFLQSLPLFAFRRGADFAHRRVRCR